MAGVWEMVGWEIGAWVGRKGVGTICDGDGFGGVIGAGIIMVEVVGVVG